MSRCQLAEADIVSLYGGMVILSGSGNPSGGSDTPTPGMGGEEGGGEPDPWIIEGYALGFYYMDDF